VLIVLKNGVIFLKMTLGRRTRGHAESGEIGEGRIMPRHPRLDGLGSLHNVMGRGIEGTKIFEADPRRDDFLSRLGKPCIGGCLVVYTCVKKARFFWQVVVGKIRYPGAEAGIL
jgi:hypothetical protein